MKDLLKSLYVLLMSILSANHAVVCSLCPEIKSMKL
jgi:hypothetical protein